MSEQRFNEGSVIKGMILGVLIGGALWLWRLPRRGFVTAALLSDSANDLRYKLDPASAAQASIAQGKAYARQNLDYEPDVQ